MSAPLLVPLALLATLATPVAAGERLGHDEARRAVERGEIRPLADILAEVRSSLVGEVVGVELKREHRKLIYEFKTVDARGRRLEIYVDAATAAIIKTEEDD